MSIVVVVSSDVVTGDWSFGRADRGRIEPKSEWNFELFRVDDESVIRHRYRDMILVAVFDK